MKRTPIRSRRSKPRPGRLKGEDLKALRLRVWDRQHGRCGECGVALPLDGDIMRRMHLAHIGNKRMWGDGDDNVRGLCFTDHMNEHNAGGKPCPAKPSTFIV